MQTFLLILAFSFQANTEPEKLASDYLLEHDLDGDGVICLQESKDDILKNFESIDSDKNHYLSKDELINYYQSKLK